MPVGAFFLVPPVAPTQTLSPTFISLEIIWVLLSSKAPSSTSTRSRPIFVFIHTPCLSYFLVLSAGLNFKAWLGTQSTFSTLLVIIDTFAVMPGITKPSVLSTDTITVNGVELPTFKTVGKDGKEYDNVYGVHHMPQIAGSYISGREVENAFREVINNLVNAKETLYEYANNINNEIDRKRAEFGLPLANNKKED